ncbi:putative ribonuclease H-like domain-containing protein [Tanacetum coccineum]
MDVNSAFLYGKIEKEVYVCQPPGFEDPDFPDRVYKVEKTLYGLHQAPKAWYETLSTYMLDNRLQRGTIDKTLFIRRDKGDILLVYVYVDDIIFGSTKKSLCTEFEKMMHKKFQMSFMGELTFFLGLQVKQKEDGVFISQDKYVTEILKKFGFTSVKTASTHMETQKPLLKDEDGEEVDVHLYRSMIGSFSLRPDIIYLKGQPKLGLWYPKDSPFDLVAYTDSDYAGSSLDRKSTTGGCQFLGDSNEKKLIQMIKIYTDKNVADLLTKAFDLQALVDGKKVIITETSIRINLQLEDAEGIDCLPNASIFEQLTLMGAKTTAWNEFSRTMTSAIICLATNQKFNFSKYIFDNMVKNMDSTGKFLMYPRFVQVFLNKQVDGMATHDEIYVTPSHTKKVFGNMKRVGKGFSGNVTPFDNIAAEAINEENVPTHSNDLLLSGEDRRKLEELMTLCTNLHNRVLDLEHTKTTQALEIESLKRRVKKLKKKQRSRTHKLKRLYKVGLSAKVVSSEDEGLDQEDASKQRRKIHDIDADEDITLENVHDKDIFGVNDLEVSTTGDAAPVSAATITTVELTLAQTLAELKSARPKVKGLVIPEQDPSESITTTTTTTTAGILL